LPKPDGSFTPAAARHCRNALSALAFAPAVPFDVVVVAAAAAEALLDPEPPQAAAKRASAAAVGARRMRALERFVILSCLRS
jgi:hypothetical protein